LRDGKNAAPHFARILAHRGEAPASPFYALARLGGARAAALADDTAAAQQHYDQFFDAWKSADGPIALLKDARRESARIR
jgi:hypothetical protein